MTNELNYVTNTLPMMTILALVRMDSVLQLNDQIWARNTIIYRHVSQRFVLFFFFLFFSFHCITFPSYHLQSWTQSAWLTKRRQRNDANSIHHVVKAINANSFIRAARAKYFRTVNLATNVCTFIRNVNSIWPALDWVATFHTQPSLVQHHRYVRVFFTLINTDEYLNSNLFIFTPIFQHHMSFQSWTINQLVQLSIRRWSVNSIQSAAIHRVSSIIRNRAISVRIVWTKRNAISIISMHPAITNWNGWHRWSFEMMMVYTWIVWGDYNSFTNNNCILHWVFIIDKKKKIFKNYFTPKVLQQFLTEGINFLSVEYSPRLGRLHWIRRWGKPMNDFFYVRT